MSEIIKIDEIDKKILFELEKNARIADVKLAKLVGKSKDAVRYRIKRLEEQKVINGYKTWIDLAKMGFRTSTLYLTLLNIPEKKEKLIKFIENDPKTYWIGVAEGSWNIGASHFIKSNEELFNIKHELISKFGDIIIDCKVTFLVGVSVHEKNFLVDKETKLTNFTEKVENLELDEISVKILKEIYWNAKENIAILADKLKTTVDIVRNRIKRLEEEKIIVRYTAVIDYQAIGYEFHKAFLYLKKYDADFFNKISRYIEGNKIIINMVRQIAPWDLELVLFTKGFAEYDNEMGDLTKNFSHNIQKIESATMSLDIIFPCNKLPLK
ncbi:MAG: winged helix-turn-helix transcriptional regulator [Nanoarchaeota archaeon]|nr:winged helix-turn-helix transcriptional regulator [Nanoarchaeota archaeon]